jgi:hypothetical protein
MRPGFTLHDWVTHPDPHLPDEFKSSHPQQTVRGMYKVCFDGQGAVTDVSVMTSLPTMDNTIMQQIKQTYRYKPQPDGLGFCTAQVLIFKIN